MLRVFLVFVGLSTCLAGQVPISFHPPILGYLLDANLHAIRPIVGVLGNSRIEAPIDLGVTVVDALFLPGQKNALIASAEFPEVLLVDLEQPGQSLRIGGAPSSFSLRRASPDGTKAALYYAQTNQLLVLDGLPTAPAVRSTVDLSFASLPLNQLAVSNDAIALLSFAGEQSEMLYAWTPSAGPRLVTTVIRASDIVFVDGDAVVADSGADQIVLIRRVRDVASPAVVAQGRDGTFHPVALSVSARKEIYIGSGETVFVMDAIGRILRKTACACTITTMAPLQESALRLTDQINRPILVLDGASIPERILFVPALTEESGGFAQ